MAVFLALIMAIQLFFVSLVFRLYNILSAGNSVEYFIIRFNTVCTTSLYQM
jgi:hypothetical protein